MKSVKPSKTLFDPIRKKVLVSTPEESVRQNIVQYLIRICKVPKQLIEIEFSLKNCPQIKTQTELPTGRADILVWKPSREEGVSPWLIVECKAITVQLNERVEMQLNRYLKSIKPQYIMLSNGPQNAYFELKENNYTEVEGLPTFSAINQ